MGVSPARDADLSWDSPEATCLSSSALLKLKFICIRFLSRSVSFLSTLLSKKATARLS